MRVNKLKTTIAMGMMGLMLWGCEGMDGSNSPTQLSVTGYASKDANRGRPTAVRLYALSSDHLFYGYDFFSLTLDAEAVLGVTLKGVLEEMYIEPGADAVVFGPYDVPKNTRSIGVIATFQNIENSRWRDTTKISDRGATEQVYVTLEGNKISVMTQAEYQGAIDAAEQAKADAEAKQQAAAQAQADSQAQARAAAQAQARAQAEQTQQQQQQQAQAGQTERQETEKPLHVWLAERDAQIRAEQAAAEAAEAAE